jgi:hypothetical protein
MILCKAGATLSKPGAPPANHKTVLFKEEAPPSNDEATPFKTGRANIDHGTG